jgi:hypothetical protein
MRPAPSPARIDCVVHHMQPPSGGADRAYSPHGGQPEPDMIMVITGRMRQLNPVNQQAAWPTPRRRSWRAHLQSALSWILPMFTRSSGPQRHIAPAQLHHERRRPTRPAPHLLTLDDRTLRDIGIDAAHALWLTYARTGPSTENLTPSAEE